MNRTFKFIFFWVILSSISVKMIGQSVGIGTASPDASAKLDITSTDRGLLIPRISLSNVSSFGLTGNSSTSGMLIYNTNASITGGNGKGFYFWNGSAWNQLSTYSTSTDWALDGNTNGSVKSIGTNDNYDFPIETNGTERIRISTTGYVGIGQTAPNCYLDITGTNGGTTSLLLRGGNTSGSTSSNQITFGYNNTTNYRHAIKTRHNAGAQLGNAIDFYVWNQGTDASTTIGSKQVMTLDGNGNVGIGVTAPANKLEVNGSGNFGSGNSVSSTNSFAMGLNNTILGSYSFASGSTNTVNSVNTVAYGSNNNVSNTEAGAFGYNNTVSGTRAFALGSTNTVAANYSIALNQSNTITSGGTTSIVGGYQSYVSANLGLAIGYIDTTTAQGAAAFGYNNNATAQYAFTSGTANIASGTNAVAFGNVSTASGSQAFTAGQGNVASGTNSIAFGQGNTVSGNSAAAIGQNNSVSATQAIAIGAANNVSANYAFAFNQSNTTTGTTSIVGGFQSYVSANLGLAIGYVDTTTAQGAAAFGYNNNATGTYALTSGSVNVASGSNAVAFGTTSTASGTQSFTTGQSNTASGSNAIAAGLSTTASGNQSIAFGQGNVSSNSNTSAFGQSNTVSGTRAVAFNQSNTASGNNSFAAGYSTTASANLSAAFGSGTTASGNQSTTFGEGNIAPSCNEFTIGSYATTYTPISTNSYNSNDRMFNVGNGTNTGSRSDAFTILKNGNIGVGVSSPTNKLEVNGTTKTTNFQLTNGATNGYVLQSDASGNGSWVAGSSLGTNYWTLSGTNLYNNSGTNVGIGTTTPANKLHVNGSGNFGSGNTVGSTNALAIGSNNTVSGSYAVAGGTANTVSSNNSVSFGSNNSVTNSESGAFGYGNTVSNTRSFAFGLTNTVAGNLSIASGSTNNISNSESGAFGYNNSVSGSRTFAFGSGNNTAGNYSVAFNQSNTTTSAATTSIVGGFQSYVSANLGIAIGYVDTTTAQGATAFGYNNNATAQYAFTSGTSNVASGTNAVAFGNTSTASGSQSVTFGQSNIASGSQAVTFGQSNTANNSNTAVFGQSNTASGVRAVAFNQSNTASGNNSFVAGYNTTASANLSAAFGSGTTASGDQSTAFGEGNTAPSYNEFVLGTYATIYTPTSTSTYNNSDRIFNVGNGTATGSRADAFTILKSGNVGIGVSSPANKLEVNGKTKTTTFQLTNGATNGYILQSDASGNGSWINSSSLSITETDPQVSSSTTNYIPKWNGTTLTDGAIYDNGTKIGIGTNTPTAILDVRTTGGAIASLIGTTSDAYYSIAAPSGAESANYLNTYSGGSSSKRWGFGKTSTSESGSNVGSDFFIQRYDDTGTLLGRSISVMRSTGYVGINGIFNPSAELEVNGTTKTATFQMTNGATNGYILQSDASGNGTWVNSSSLSIAETDPQVSSTTLNYHSKWNGTTLIDGIIYDDGTNIGIGTSSPSTKLEISGTTKTTNLQMTSGATNGYVLQSDASGNGTWVDATALTITESDPQVSSTTTNYIPKWNGTTLTDGVVYDNGTNIGIGTASPTEKLEVSGKTKTTNFQMTSGATNGYVLQSDASGNGSWVDVSSLSITETDPQVSSTTTNYIPKWSGTTLNDGIIYDNGTNIGIGTTSPINKLDIQSTTGSVTSSVQSSTSTAYFTAVAPSASEAAAKFSTYSGGSASTRWLMGKSNGSESGSNAGSNFFVNRYNDAGTYLGQPFSINRSNGYIGIGTTSYLYNMSFDGTANQTIGMTRATSTNEGYDLTIVAGGAASGNNDKGGGDLILSGGLSTGNGNVLVSSNIIFKTSTPLGSSSSADQTQTEKMRITGAGNVGIGTTNPTKAKVEISGSVIYPTNGVSFRYYNSASVSTSSTTGSEFYSLYANARIGASEFNAFSDARIKRIKGISNSDNDLITLLNIKIKDYSLIDTIAKGKKMYKKVIAQELKAVYPQAVSTHRDVIPDIYQISTISKGFVSLPQHKVKVGEKIKLIFDDEEDVYEVIETNENGFLVNSTRTSGVFVYGKEVEDFHTVDYEALSTLNISATQALFKQLTELQTENKGMKADISSLKAAVFGVSNNR